MRNGRRTPVAACAVAILAAVVGCGSSSEASAVSASVYVTSVCQAVGPFEREIAASSSALDPAGRSTPAQVKRVLEGFLSSIALDAHSAVGELTAAKYPDVRDGRAIGRAFVAIFRRIETAMRAAARTSSRLPTTSAAAFRTADRALGQGVERSVAGDLGAGIAVLRNHALEAAADRAAACRTLG